MVRHLVMWNFRAELTGEEQREAARRIKTGLEALPQVIPGILHIEVVTSALGTGTHALLLDSLFEDESALANYQAHPSHGVVAAHIRAVTTDRCAVDYTTQAQ